VVVNLPAGGATHQAGVGKHRAQLAVAHTVGEALTNAEIQHQIRLQLTGIARTPALAVAPRQGLDMHGSVPVGIPAPDPAIIANERELFVSAVGESAPLRHGISEGFREKSRAVPNARLTGGDGPQDHSSLLASSAPCASDSSFAHMIDGCTRRWNGPCANPQSVPAITFSRPRILARRAMRSATSSGCSTTLVAWLITPGMRICPGASFTVFQTCHSCSCRGLAPSMT